VAEDTVLAACHAGDVSIRVYHTMTVAQVRGRWKSALCVNLL
jgi:hypothetical protein